LDKRVLIGLAAVIVISVGVYVLVLNQPPAPPDGNGGVPQKATVRGVIKDADGNLLQGATVKLGAQTVTTGADGAYTFSVDAGSYTLTVTKQGFDQATSTVTATAGQESVQNLALAKTPTGAVELKIITRHGSDILFKARDAFMQSDLAKQYKIEKISFLSVSGSLWADTIRRSDDIDIGWGGGPVIFDVVNNEGLLAPLTSAEVTAILDQLPDEISGSPTKRGSGGKVYWVGSAISSFGFTVNTEFLSTEGLPEPKTWKDLTNETYAVTLPSITSIGTADATLSTSNTRMFEIILQTYGWDEGWKLLTLMGANARIFDQSESVRDAAIQGTIGAGTTIDFYGYTAQLENPEICKYVLPEDGTAVNADPIALTTTSKNPEAAQAFIAWVLSAEGQTVWLDPTINRMPINPAVFDTPEGQARVDLEESYEATKNAIVIEFSDDLALSYEISMMYFYHDTLVVPQSDLIDAWLELTSAEKEEEITHQQFLALADDLGDPQEFTFKDPDTGQTVAFTEEYAQSVNDRLATDAAFKDQLRSAWSAAAKVRYDKVMADLNALIG
jgi:ABC-type Fe3+ transport system substrate-binding protein